MFGDNLLCPMVRAQTLSARSMAEGRVQDQANEPAARGPTTVLSGPERRHDEVPVNCFKPVEVRPLPPVPQALFGVTPEEMTDVTPRATHHS